MGMLSMKLRIWKKKPVFIHHIKNLKDTDLAKQIWKEQLDQDWPGLVKEAKVICSELAIVKACKLKDK